jgi:hypothetical protein
MTTTDYFFVRGDGSPFVIPFGSPVALIPWNNSSVYQQSSSVLLSSPSRFTFTQPGRYRVNICAEARGNQTTRNLSVTFAKYSTDTAMGQPLTSCLQDVVRYSNNISIVSITGFDVVMVDDLSPGAYAFYTGSSNNSVSSLAQFIPQNSKVEFERLGDL